MTYGAYIMVQISTWHVTSRSSPRSIDILGRVKFGDDSFVEIQGKGSLLFNGNGGVQKLLTDIYYVPNLKANIISLGQATEIGCEISMKRDQLYPYDSHETLMFKVKRLMNRMYKIGILVGRPICLHSHQGYQNR